MSDAIPLRDGQLDLGAAERLTLDTPHGPIAALAAGDANATPVLLLPGYTGSKEDFGPILDPLAAGALRPVAIDLPGQFESPGPQHASGYSTEALGRVVLAAALSLGPRVHLVGHSFGGLVARAAVLADPSAFASLVLMDSGPAEIGGPRRALIDHLGPALAEVGVPGVYDATLMLAAAEPDYVPPPPALAEFLRRRFLAGSAAMLQGMGDALRVEPDRVADLAAVPLPMLVLYGAEDDAWPPAVQDEMAARLGARRVVVPDAAHSPAVENPGVTAAELVNFLCAVPQ
jgi:pimeloyl-ACP methyl ester carboxylesterase